jgi:predicted aspartyl protease
METESSIIMKELSVMASGHGFQEEDIQKMVDGYSEIMVDELEGLTPFNKERQEEENYNLQEQESFQQRRQKAEERKANAEEKILRLQEREEYLSRCRARVRILEAEAEQAERASQRANLQERVIGKARRVGEERENYHDDVADAKRKGRVAKIQWEAIGVFSGAVSGEASVDMKRSLEDLEREITQNWGLLGNLSEEEKKTLLRLKIQGPAKSQMRQLEIQDPEITAEEIFRNFEEIFVIEDYDANRRKAHRLIKQKANENIIDFCNRYTQSASLCNQMLSSDDTFNHFQDTVLKGWQEELTKFKATAEAFGGLVSFQQARTYLAKISKTLQREPKPVINSVHLEEGPVLKPEMLQQISALIKADRIQAEADRKAARVANTCKFCDKVGHLEPACFKKHPNLHPKAKYVEQDGRQSKSQWYVEELPIDTNPVRIDVAQQGVSSVGNKKMSKKSNNNLRKVQFKLKPETIPRQPVDQTPKQAHHLIPTETTELANRKWKIEKKIKPTEHIPTTEQVPPKKPLLLEKQPQTVPTKEQVPPNRTLLLASLHKKQGVVASKAVLTKTPAQKRNGIPTTEQVPPKKPLLLEKKPQTVPTNGGSTKATNPIPNAWQSGRLKTGQLQDKTSTPTPNKALPKTLISPDPSKEPTGEESINDIEPEEEFTIDGHRINGTKLQYLVKYSKGHKEWTTYTADDPAWEESQDLVLAFQQKNGLPHPTPKRKSAKVAAARIRSQAAQFPAPTSTQMLFQAMAKTPGSGIAYEIMALLDTGANANLVDPELLEHMEHSVIQSNDPINSAVYLDGSTAPITGSVRIKMNLQGIEIDQIFLVSPTRSKLVLGLPWFNEVTATIKWKERAVVITTAEKKTVIIHPLADLEVMGFIRVNSLHVISPEATAQDEEAVGTFGEDAQKIIRAYPTVFSQGSPIDRDENIQIKEKEGSQPTTQNGARKLNTTEAALLKNNIYKLLAQKQIQVSTSPYAAGVMFIKKPDGTMRMCIDYRNLNAQTIKDKCPMPNPADLRYQVKDAKWFTKMDFRDGYYNIKVHVNSRQKTAFVTREGLFEFLVMPFGLTNAPAVFSAMMNRLFGHLKDVSVIFYLDDIVIYSKTKEEHTRHIKEVMDILRREKLFLKLSKCSFYKKEVEFCGHVISGEGVSIAESKVVAISSTPTIQSKKDLEKFIGISVWFKEFIEDYATIMFPLTELMKKDKPFQWEQEQKAAVLQIITAITKAPVLKHFDPDRETRVYTDASLYAIGGWIAQKYNDGWHPVTFLSRKLTAAESNYTVQERELLALVYVLRKQGHYLRTGMLFEVNVDCSSLKYLKTVEILNQRQARWILELQEYNMQIKHISGATNVVADYLSRSTWVAPLCESCKRQIKIFSMEVRSPQSLYLEEASNDALLGKVKAWASNRDNQHPESEEYKQFEFRHNRWWYKGKIYIPNGSTALISDILDRHHDDITAGHQGIHRTSTRIKDKYYWPNMGKDIKAYVESCVTCQRHHTRTTLLHGKLHPLPIPHDRFKDISIDFAKINRSSAGFDSLMVIVCRLTKLVKLIPCRTTDSTMEIARLFLRHWYAMGAGLPDTIVSDRDTRFVSKLWTELAVQLKIKLEMSTARHQQTDGQSEITIKTYKRIASKYCTWDNANWHETVPLVEFAMNTSVSASTGFTAFQLAFGFTPRLIPEDYVHQGRIKEDLATLLQTNLEAAKKGMALAQTRQSVQYNKRRGNAPEYQVGDLVLLASEGINWPSFKNRPKEAIPKFYGPFRIIAIDRERENLTLALPDDLSQGSSKIHPVFHTSKVKPFVSRVEHGADREAYERPVATKCNEEGEELFVVDRILDRKTVKGITHYLVGYNGYPDSHGQFFPFNPKKQSDINQWKDDWHILQQFDPSVGNFPSKITKPPHVPQLRRSTRVKTTDMT